MTDDEIDRIAKVYAKKNPYRSIGRYLVGMICRHFLTDLLKTYYINPIKDPDK